MAGDPDGAKSLRFIADALAHDLADQCIIPDQWCATVANTISTAILEDRLARGFGYEELERRMMAAICERFGLPAAMPEEVRDADDVVLATELRDLWQEPPANCLSWAGAEPMEQRIRPWCPEVAKDLFMVRFERLKARAS